MDRTEDEGLNMRPAWLKNWLIRSTPPCREVVRLLSEAMDRPIPLRRRIAVRLHFLICKWCERYQKQIELIRALLRRDDPSSLEEAPPDAHGPRLSEEARERLKRLTRKEPS